MNELIKKYISDNKIITNLNKTYYGKLSHLLDLFKKNKISKNGCSDDDYIYSSFLLGQQNILDIVIEELRVFLEIYGDKNE